MDSGILGNIGRVDDDSAKVLSSDMFASLLDADLGDEVGTAGRRAQIVAIFDWPVGIVVEADFLTDDGFHGLKLLAEHGDRRAVADLVANADE